jgi:hypothetical protein
MSRGLGHVQREIMEWVERLHDRRPHERWVSLRVIAQSADDRSVAAGWQPPSPARVESVRRAARSLVAKELLERAASGEPRVRKPLTKAERRREYAAAKEP